MTHEELSQLAGAYALGALDGEDLAEFRQHLPGCWDCRQRVLEFEEIYAEGSLALAPLKPSPETRNKLLQRISGVGPAMLPPQAPPTGASPLPPVPLPPAPLPSVAPAPTPPPAPWFALATLACAALALAAGLGWSRARAEAHRLRDEVERVRAEGRAREGIEADLDRLEAVLRETRARMHQTERQTEELAIELQVWRRLLRQPDTRTEALRGAGSTPQASARVLWGGSEVALIAVALPPLPPERRYALWAIQGERKLLAGLFEQPGPGTLIGLTRDLPAPLDQVEAFAVTPEPASGADAPTGEVLLRGRVQ